jgi:RNA-directed DNA polymerase
MKESYEEGSASHLGPESYADGGNAMGVAMTGVHAGQVLSSEISTIRVPTLSNCGEGHMCHDINGELWHDAAESKTLCMHGNSRRENREILLVSSRQRHIQCPGERPENVNDGNAGMNANRKSDGPIVPAKRTNKTETPATESAEERGSPKGNAASIYILAPDTRPDFARQCYEQIRQVKMVNHLDRYTQGRSRMR